MAENINVEKLSVTSVDQITAFNNAREVEFIMDEIQESTLSNTQEKTDILGRGGRKISSLKKNKAATFTATNGFIVGGALAAQTGSDVTYGENTIVVSEIVAATEDNKVTITRTPVGTKGAEIRVAYKKNANGTLGQKFTQDATASEGKFAFDSASKALTFNEGEVKTGEEIVVFYEMDVTSARIDNDSTKFSKTLELIIDVTAQDNCDNLFHGQFIFPRADFNGEFEIAMGGDPAVHNIEVETLAGGCTGSNQLWSFIVFTDDELGE